MGHHRSTTGTWPMGPGDHTTKAILETPIDSRNLNTPEHPDTQHPLCNSNANRLRRNKYTLHVIYIYITLVCLCVFSLIACSLGNIHLGNSQESQSLGKVATWSQTPCPTQHVAARAAAERCSGVQEHMFMFSSVLSVSF